MIMETLNNFASIYCFITFVIGAVFMLAILSIAAMGKVKEPRNNVRFYIKRVHDGFELWLKDTSGCYTYITHFGMGFNYIFLNTTGSFKDMKCGEIREVNLMED